MSAIVKLPDALRGIIAKPPREITMAEVEETKSMLLLKEIFLKFAREKKGRLYEIQCNERHGWYNGKRHEGYEMRPNEGQDVLVKICFFLGWCPNEGFVDIFISTGKTIKRHELRRELIDKIYGTNFLIYRTIYIH